MISTIPSFKQKNITAKLQYILYSFGLFCLPAAAFLAPLSVTGTNISIFSAAACSLLSGQFFAKFYKVKANPLVISILMIFIFAVFAMFWSVAPWNERLSSLHKYGKLLYFIFLIPLCLEEKWRDRAVNAFLIAMILTVSISFLKQYANITFGRSPKEASWIFHSHIETSYFVAFSAYIFMYRVISTAKYKWLYVVLCLLFTWQEFFINDGRTGWLVYLVLVIMFFGQVSLKQALEKKDIPRSLKSNGYRSEYYSHTHLGSDKAKFSEQPECTNEYMRIAKKHNAISTWERLYHTHTTQLAHKRQGVYLAINFLKGIFFGLLLAVILAMVFYVFSSTVRSTVNYAVSNYFFSDDPKITPSITQTNPNKQVIVIKTLTNLLPIDQQHQIDNVSRQQSVDYRIDFFKFSIAIIKEHPMIGIGTGGFKAAFDQVGEIPGWETKLDHPHNEYLLTLVQFGIIGLVLLLYFFYLQWKISFMWIKDWPVAQALVLSFMLGSCYNAFLYTTVTGHFYVLFVALFFSANVSNTNNAGESKDEGL